jgi:hypothetical protein
MKIRPPSQSTHVAPQAPEKQPGTGPGNAASPPASSGAGGIAESRSARGLVTGQLQLDKAADITEKTVSGAMPGNAGAANTDASPRPGRAERAARSGSSSSSSSTQGAGIELGVKVVRSIVTSHAPGRLSRLRNALQPLQNALAATRTGASRDANPAPPAPAHLLAAVTAAFHEWPE